MAAGGEIEIREAGVAEIIPLRHAVLRAGLPVETAHFAGDESAEAFHVGAFDRAGVCVGCATLHLNEWEGARAFQLRGMAVAEGWRGTGLGRELLVRCEQHAAARGVSVLWCNARSPAVAFYEKGGWRRVGEEFVIPTAGPHFKMCRRLESGNSFTGDAPGEPGG